MTFKKTNGETIESLENYILNYFNEHENVYLYIGTDSQRKKKKYTYITTICFRQPCNGVHVIYKKHTFERNVIPNLYIKLWKEVELTVEVLNHLVTFLDKSKITVDLDYNVLKEYSSNIVHDSAKGWVAALGVNVRSKPNAWAASYAADHLTHTNND